jgi:uncharacterized cupin superfamily protein
MQPGRWRRQIMQAEFRHFVQGRCRFIPDAGSPIGHCRWRCPVFSRQQQRVWEVSETVRKTYVLLPD